MADLKINAEAVVRAAENIRNFNNTMRDSFDSVQDAISRLDNYWEGSAATSVISKFGAIKNNYCDARYSVLSNYIGFMLQQVGEGYNQTEEVNKSLADAFK